MNSPGEASSSGDSGLPLQVDRPAARWPRRRWAMWLLGGSAAVALGVAGLPRVLPDADQGPGAAVTAVVDAPVAPRESGMLAALGHLEPLGGLVTLTAPGASADGRLAQVLVAPGEAVAAQQILAILAQNRRAEAALAAARAQVSLRDAEIERTRRTIASGRAEAEAAAGVARARLLQGELALARAERLAGSRAIPETEVEDQRTQVEVLRAELARAEAQLVPFSGDPERHPDLLAAQAARSAAEADARVAQADVENTVIRAPFGGVVLEVPGRAGAVPGDDGIVRLAAEGPMAAVLEVNQSRIDEVAPGDEVELRGDALPRPLQGRVREIGLEVRAQAQVGPDPAARTDARVFEVRVELDAASSEIARRLVNLQVLATIRTGAGS